MRISGITLPDNKRLEIALTAIYGIGRATSKQILEKLGIDLGKKTKELSSEEEDSIRKEVENYIVEGDLKRQTSANIKRLIDIASYRGIRHTKKLPVRGQNTKTNSRTVRGNRRTTMGSGKVKVTKK